MRHFLLAVIALLAAGCGGESSSVRQQGSSGPAAPPRIVEYRVVEEWSIPNGGFGRAVVIPDSASNERSLRALGDEFRHDTRGDRNAFIFVFTNARAAGLRRTVLSDRITKADEAYYDKHLVAMYSRNINTGFHQLSMTPKGLNGPQIDVTY